MFERTLACALRLPIRAGALRSWLSMFCGTGQTGSCGKAGDETRAVWPSAIAEVVHGGTAVGAGANFGQGLQDGISHVRSMRGLSQRAENQSGRGHLHRLRVA